MRIETLIQKETNTLSHYTQVLLISTKPNQTYLGEFFLGGGCLDLNMDENTEKENIYYYELWLER